MSSQAPDHVGHYLAAFAIAALIAGGAYTAALARAPQPDPWADDPMEMMAREAFRFYERESRALAESPFAERRVYFLGASSVRDGIDAYAVEARLRVLDAPPTLVYNLGVAEDTGLRRLPELPAILEARPDIVVIGLLPLTLTDEGASLRNRLDAIDDVAPPIHPGSDLATLLGEAASELTPPAPDGSARGLAERWRERWEARVRVMDAIDRSLTAHEPALEPTGGLVARPIDELRGNVKDPWMYDRIETSSEDLEAGRAGFAKRNALWNVTRDDGPAVAALDHFVRTLQENGIRVHLLQMPLNPAYAEAEASENRTRYDRLVTAIAARHDAPLHRLDLPAGYFVDYAHLNARGRAELSRAMGDALLVDAAG